MLVKKWDIRLLGKIEAGNGDLKLGRFATKHSAILFAFLSRKAGKRVTRDQLVDLLWPDADLTTGRTRLRVALVSLRKRLEPLGTPPGAVLLSDREAITLRAEAADIDANRFKTLVTQGLCATSTDQAIKLLSEADELYRGPFCDGIDHEWVEIERDSLTSAYISAQVELSNLLFAQGDLKGATSHARKAVEANPLDEPARQTLLKSLMIQGSKDAARLEYDDYSRLLHEEIGMEPSAPTAQILTQNLPGTKKAQPEPPQTPEPNTLLPRFFDEYIQREGEFALLEELILTSRVVSLVGPVGIGKTRLAIEFAGQLTKDTMAWFASARPDENRHLAELLLSEISSTQAADDPITELQRIYTRETTTGKVSRVLVVIDDAHHLPPAFKNELKEILAQIPGIVFLFTAPGKLGIPGEQLHQAEPLKLPDQEDHLASNPCIRLFLTRAHAVHPEFHLTNANAKDLARLCCALDGIPLALELAASQVRKSPLQTLFTNLSGAEPQDREAWRHPRHRTLDSAFRVNRDALAPQDIESLALLTIFQGSWNIEAANAVLPRQDAKAVLDRLVSHALVVVEPTPYGPRYRMLGSIKQFASQDAPPEILQTASHRHARHFLRVALTFAASVGQGGFSFQKLSPLDRDNLKSAFIHLVGDPDSHREAAMMACALTWYWIFTGILSQGMAFVRLISPQVQKSDTAMVTRLALAEGILECFGPDPARAVEILSANVDKPEVQSDPWLQGYARWGLVFATYSVGDYAASESNAQTAILLFNQLGADWWSACTRHLLGSTLLAMGDVDLAKEVLQSSIDQWQECGDRYISVASYMILARVAWVAGDLETARRVYLECFEVYRKSGDARLAMFCLEGLGRVACSSGRMVEAARLFGLAERTREENGLKLDVTDSAAHEKTLGELRHALGETLDEEWSLGRSATWSTYLPS